VDLSCFRSASGRFVEVMKEEVREVEGREVRNESTRGREDSGEDLSFKVIGPASDSRISVGAVAPMNGESANSAVWVVVGVRAALA
jgi:hypothetical protein